jgi:hypothetical protein
MTEDHRSPASDQTALDVVERSLLFRLLDRMIAFGNRQIEESSVRARVLQADQDFKALGAPVRSQVFGVALISAAVVYSGLLIVVPASLRPIAPFAAPLIAAIGGGLLLARPRRI